MTLPDGSFLAYTYDDARRLTAITNQIGEKIEFTYDLARNVTQQVTKDSGGTIRRTQTRAYDELSRPASFVLSCSGADPLADLGAYQRAVARNTGGVDISRDGIAEKRSLQACVLLAAAVPVAAGLAGIVGGPGMVDLAGGSASQDSHARYLSGLLLGIGLAFWSTVPGIERRGARFRLLAAIVVLGGLGRLVSLLAAGQPSAPMLAGLGLELAAVPLLALWQARLAARA